MSRKLRIAWSVACVIACVLLIALWVRSYWRCDIVSRMKSGQVTNICSNRGVSYFFDGTRGSPIIIADSGWRMESVHATNLPGGARWTWTPTLRAAQLPDWCAVLVFATFAIIPWIRWPSRFSLRTLLIATTLIAVVLGIIAWMSRAG
jgi:hypothetical protein